jgi:predicted nucleic acid-binding protein
VSSIVVDASVVAGWVLGDEANAYTESVAALIAEGCRPVAPILLTWEITNLLLTAEKRGRLPVGTSAEALIQLRELPWDWDQPSGLSPLLHSLARRHGLTAYDAAYLLLALERDLALATQDQALRRAAQAEGIKLHEARTA